MKKIILITLSVLSLNVWAQKQIHEATDLAKIIQGQKLVAILPFDAKITYKKQPKNYSAEGNRQSEITMSKNIQQSMYTFLLRKKADYSVDFQEVDKTNVLLKKAGILDKIDEFTKEEIAKALGVDAVIGGKFDQEQSKSEAGAIAATVLFGGFGSKTGSGSLTMTINNGTDGALLWRFFKTMDDNVFASTDELIERMMRKVSRNFPYKK